MTDIALVYCAGIFIIGIAGLVVSGGNRNGGTVPPAMICCFSVIALSAVLFYRQKPEMLSIISLSGWQLPFAKLTAGCDPLSLLFFIPLLILTTCSALFGPRYMAGHPPVRAHWFFFCLLISGMTAVLIARNAVFFILSWEIMSLASFFLVISDMENETSVKAGWLYFVTAHIGTAFLLGLFFMLSSITESFDFITWKSMSFTRSQTNIIFLLAMVGFGFKAGFIPFHVWLPQAHPAAPSHVSSIMSGIMIKMGVYGILRILTFISPFQVWWGIVFIVLGGGSAFLGILFAMGQKDIKRLLAYSSVENMGIIIIAIGLGMMGVYYESTAVTLFGFAGAFLHIVNHALFKSLLFLGAGAIIKQTGTGEIDRLGGLIKVMPKTATAFLLGILGICSLPFLNGFISELFMYTGSISGTLQTTQPVLALTSLSVIVLLGLTGGLAIACFVKFFGITFLGESRCDITVPTGETPLPMLVGLWIPAVLCIVIGLCSNIVLPFIIGPLPQFLPFNGSVDIQSLYSLSTTTSIILCSCGLLIAITATVRRCINRNNQLQSESTTWDCGYNQPDAPIQYTASSFTAPIIDFFSKALAAKTTVNDNKELFPGVAWSFATSVDDWFLSKLFAPAARSLFRFFSWLQWLQGGKTGFYVLYIALAVLGIIIWKFAL